MPKVSQQYRDARRDQILDAARRCFLRDGFHATSMQDLFAEAGLSSGAVYRYFASKDDVIIAIAEDNMRDVVAMIRTAAARQAGRPPGATLADILEILQAKDAENGLGQIALLVWAEALRSPVIAARFTGMLTQLRGGLAEIVREHQEASGRPPGAPAEALAAVLLAIVPGYVLQLALLGPAAVAGLPDAVRALWSPPAETESRRPAPAAQLRPMAGNRVSCAAMDWRARMPRSSWVTPAGYRSRMASKSHRSARAAYPAISRSSSARRLRAALRLVAWARATKIRAAIVMATPQRLPQPNSSSIARVKPA